MVIHIEVISRVGVKQIKKIPLVIIVNVQQLLFVQLLHPFYIFCAMKYISCFELPGLYIPINNLISILDLNPGQEHHLYI